MTGTLIITNGPLEGRKIPLRGKKTVLGRGHDCDVQILDEMLSRVHCLIEKWGDAYSVTDLNSRNGTLVDGERVANAELKNGQVITLGKRELRYVEAGPAPQPVAAVNLVPGNEGEDAGIQRIIDPDETTFLSDPAPDADEKALSRLHNDLATIYKIGTLINSEHDLERLYGLIVDSILEVVPGERALLMVRSADGGVNPVVSRSRGGEQGVELSISRTILNETLDRGRAVLISGAMMDKNFEKGDSIVLNHINSAMCVPLQTKDKVTGAIYLDTVGISNAFGDSDLELLSAIGRQAGVALERARLIEDLANLFYDSVTSLVAAIEASDEYTAGHSERVTKYAVRIARAMGYDEDTVNRVRTAGLLHDIGKISIPHSVLNKNGPLDEEQWRKIKTHPDVGARIIGNIRQMEAGVAEAVRHHHERWNGTGYPGQLKGKDIPFMSRILAVADAYDAMTSQRPYRKAAFSREDAIAELRANAGAQFDEMAVETFVGILDQMAGKDITV